MYVGFMYFFNILLGIIRNYMYAVSSIQECSTRLSQGNLEGRQLEQCG